jgi:hypothetical protein
MGTKQVLKEEYLLDINVLLLEIVENVREGLKGQ